MNKAWSRAQAAFNARSRRERGLLLGAAVALLALVGEALFIEPALLQRKRLQQTIDQQGGELQNVQAQLQALQGRQQHPDAARKAQIEVLRGQLARVDDNFAQFQRSLVTPQEMGRLIEGLLKQHGGLQLLSLRSLPVAPLNDGRVGGMPGAAATAPPGAAPPASAPATAATAAATAAAAASAAREPADAWLYLHGVQLSVRGSYADMQAYLGHLEQLPRRVYWGALTIDGKAWPASVMTVTLYTVSLEKTWWAL